MGAFNREKVKGLAGTQGDMHQGSHFIIEIAGHVVGGIEKIEGLKDTHDVIQSRDTDDGVGHMRGRPGNKKHHTFKLYRQYGATDEFINWFQQTRDGKVARKTVTITYYNDADEAQSQTHIGESWPFAYGIEGFDSKSSNHLREYIECAAEHIRYGK